ncbi:PTS system mannose/fructose/sorbose family transporter subunit IID [bacterium]|nr:PTS system mannose/fructose/sorbose family transporter subunit IID [bacterium]
MPPLGKVDFVRVLYRCFFIQAAWNYERMLGLGYCACLMPFLKKRISGQTERSDFLKRNLGFFNTHPYMASWILGAVMKLEDQHVDSSQIDRFKKRLSSSLAAVGDQLFWSDFKSLSVMLAALCALYNAWTAIPVFLIVYNLPHFIMRIKGLREGYRRGFDVIKVISMQKFRPLLDALLKTNAVVAGLLLVFLAKSNLVGRVPELVAFVAGGLAMIYLIKWRVPTPAALVLLLVVTVIAGLVIL